jgi:hypothetical protein
MNNNNIQHPILAKNLAHLIWDDQETTRGTMSGCVPPIVTITRHSSPLLYIWSEGAAHDPMMINQYSFGGTAAQIVKKANYKRYRQALRENRLLSEYLSYRGQEVIMVFPSWRGKKCISFMNQLRALEACRVDRLYLLLKVSEERLETEPDESPNHD